MSLFGYGDLFSASARKLGDQFALTQMTGSPWGLGEDPELKVSVTQTVGYSREMTWFQVDGLAVCRQVDLENSVRAYMKRGG